mmetsp:Transcript_6968/g.12711  ORF Transcript_6968/g.12711 Transcript_6968/m.12711 type:complete len:471 (-) Transcript_6968:1245-2657(-)
MIPCQLCRVCKQTPIDTLTAKYAKALGKPVCQDCINKIKSGDYEIQPERHELRVEAGSFWCQGHDCESHNHMLSLGCSVCGSHCDDCPVCCGTEIDLAKLGEDLFVNRQKVAFLLRISKSRSGKEAKFKELEEDLSFLSQGSNYRELAFIEAKINSTYAALQILDHELAFIGFHEAVELLETGRPFPLHPLKGPYLHWFEWGKSQLHLKNVESRVNITLHLRDFIVPFYSRSICLNDGSIFLSGGRPSTTDFGVRECFLISYVSSQITITKMPLMTHGRSNHALAVLDGNIFAIGGCNHRNVFFDKVERLGSPSKNWEECASTPDTRDSINGLADEVNHCIYVAGGRVDNGNMLDTILKYQVLDDYWTLLELVLPAQVDTCGLVFVPGNLNQIIIFGGLDDQHESSNLVFIADLHRQQATQTESMQGAGGCIVNESKVFGGYLYVIPFFGYETRSYERCNLETMKWEILS